MLIHDPLTVFEELLSIFDPASASREVEVERCHVGFVVCPLAPVRPAVSTRRVNSSTKHRETTTNLSGQSTTTNSSSMSKPQLSLSGTLCCKLESNLRMVSLHDLHFMKLGSGSHDSLAIFAVPGQASKSNREIPLYEAILRVRD